MKSKKSLVIVVIAVIIIGVLTFQYINHTGPFKNNNPEQHGPEHTEKVHIDRVVDGDTFVAHKSNGDRIKVRLIGIDTPETVKPNTPVQPYGKEASNYSKRHLNQKDVFLEYDKEKEDRYGRTLAYVWLDNQTLYNKKLVEEGLAREKYFSPNGKYRQVFKKAEQKAKEQHLNLWNK
ncbi:thermonuclease family protein [Staphylococcus sp. SQ8-PEA]|uniref:Thermonuclease n=1 Tax=Staphylococcus marylandisciuri TaxID=2981529 RepID=A0ABT2QNP9_9STAP|nr:thermonuclease family protein [Staphylococcus marylandisciuri]MCU5745605.1 thermonuclease family protein [Staphylococcus marylandisciuri]